METGEQISIVVDDREPADVSNHLESLEDVKISEARLSLGDYLFDRRIVFERKTFLDFVAAIKSGRLFNQACRLASSNYRPVIILEGGLADIRKSNMRRESIQGAIINLTVILGLPLLRSQSPEETARLIVYTGRQLQRIPYGAVYRHGYRPKGDRKRKLFVLQGLPGIGPERAARLLDHFGSLEAVFFAEPDEIANVVGIGYPTAARIRALVRELGEKGYSCHQPN